ncbi:MAG: hypothetical protein QOF96_49, partial [Actinomycetota bacterium]|nr:hypothetical protein [Actinomycetota bacterium]
IGDTLRIANATATASVVRAPGAEPVRTADFSATGVSIAGQAVAYVTNSAVAGIPAPAANAGATTETDPGPAPGTASPAGPVDGASVGAGFRPGPVASSAAGPGPASGFGSGGPGLSSGGTAAPQVAASDPVGSGAVALGTGRVPSRLATPASLGRPIHSGSVTGPYLLLVVGGLVATAVSTLLRRKAVQSA